MRRVLFIWIVPIVLALAGTAIGLAVALPGGKSCTVTDRLVPTCGRWWGAAIPSSGSRLAADVGRLESMTGRRMDVVHVFHRWNEAFPTTSEQQLLTSGHVLFENWQPTTSSGAAVPWAAIASGSQDAVIDREASRLRALGVPLFLSFSHEPELNLSDSPAAPATNGAPPPVTNGTAAQFVAAWRHVIDRLRADGVHNAVFAWTVMGLGSGSWPARYAQLWPGGDYVDWVAWDPYNMTCANKSSRTFSRIVGPFYGWLVGHGHGDKPMMLAEYGTSGTPAQQQQWYEQVPGQLANFPRLKALVYFDYPSPPATCDWRPLGSAAAAFGALARSGPFAPTARFSAGAPLP